MAKNKAEIEDQLDGIEEVTEQEVAAAPSQANDFFQKNKIYILGIGALVLLAGGYFGWNYLNKSKNKEAYDAAFQAVYYWEKDSLNKAINGDGVALGLQSIVDEYGSTDVGNQAKYMLGIAAIKQGKIDEGIAHLKSFSKGDNLVSAAAELAMGFALEDKGDEAGAAEHFEKAAGYTTEKDDQFRPMCLKLAGEAYEAAGNKSKALNLYKTIKDKYPNSQEGQTIDKYIGRAE